LHFRLLALQELLYYVPAMKSTKVIRKKMGRPRIGAKPAMVVPIRLPEEIIKAVDAYAKSEVIKSRAEAFRRLVEEALAARGLAAEPASAKSRRPAKRGVTGL
jgi:Ribbon-helix-helix protein, copG family